MQVENKDSMAGRAIDDHTCPICICVLVKPVKLPCNHWLCISCSDDLVNNEADDITKCPLCRRDLEPNFPNRFVNRDYDETLRKEFPEEYAERLAGIERAQKENRKEKKIVFFYGNRHENCPENSYNPHRWTAYVELPNKNIESYVESIEFVIHPSYSQMYVIVMKAPFEITRTGYGLFNVSIIIRWKRWLVKEPTRVEHFLDFRAPDTKRKLVVKYLDKWGN